MKRLAVLVSNAGTGTNLQGIINAIKKKELKAKISVVISGDKNAYGLKRAIKNKIKTEVCLDKKLLLSILGKYNVDYICLAGWRHIIAPVVIKVYSNKILNLHPGLIPNKIDGQIKNPDKTNGLWNRGKLTNTAIANFLNNNASYAGSSIHFLSDEFDFGKVMGRCFERINKGDSIDSLYKRLKKKENVLYVKVLKKLCN